MSFKGIHDSISSGKEGTEVHNVKQQERQAKYHHWLLSLFFFFQKDDLNEVFFKIFPFFLFVKYMQM